MWTIGTVSVPSTYTAPNYSTINDGNWHHLVHVAQRSANCTTYLDGVQVDSEAIVEAGSATTSYAATIGQDATGVYPATAGANLNDLAVWTRTLSQLEVSGIYLAGATNNVSFAPAVVVAPPPVSTTISNIINNLNGTFTINYGGGAGTQFILVKSLNPNLTRDAWTPVQTNGATPGSFTSFIDPTNWFFSIQSQ